MNLLVNWKTTSAGIAAIAGAITGFAFGFHQNNLTPELVTGYITALLTGIGLLFARDVNVTSTDLGLQTVQRKESATTVVVDKPAK